MKILDCPQRSDAWFAMRCGIPTCSNLHKLITPKKWEYASGAKGYIRQLIAESYFPSLANGGFTSEDTCRGEVLEPEAVKYWEFTHNCTIQPVGFILSDSEDWGGSPDGLIGDDSGLEVKCPRVTTQIDWLLTGGVPPEHLAQCHGLMLLTGRDSWNFLSYCDGLPHLEATIERDEKTEFLKAALDKFLDELKETKEKIAAMFGPPPTRTVDYGELGTIEVDFKEPSYW